MHISHTQPFSTPPGCLPIQQYFRHAQVDPLSCRYAYKRIAARFGCWLGRRDDLMSRHSFTPIESVTGCRRQRASIVRCHAMPKTNIFPIDNVLFLLYVNRVCKGGRQAGCGWFGCASGLIRLTAPSGRTFLGGKDVGVSCRCEEFDALDACAGLRLTGTDCDWDQR